MYYIAICDDDINFIRYMRRLLLRSGLDKDDTKICEFSSGEELVAMLGSMEQIDLLVLDMQMKELDGNATARRFRQLYPSSVIVFCSGVCQPTVESFETSPFRYLLKEYTEERMMSELETIVLEVKKRKGEPEIIGTWNHNFINLRPEEILYIAIARNGCNVFVHPDSQKYGFEKQVTCRKKLTELYDDLRGYGFEYAHNSYIVNMNYIKRKTPYELEMTDGTILTISRSKERQLRSAFARYKGLKY